LPKRSFLMSQPILLAIVLTQLSISLNTYFLSHNHWGRSLRPPRRAVGHPPASCRRLILPLVCTHKRWHECFVRLSIHRYYSSMYLLSHACASRLAFISVRMCLFVRSRSPTLVVGRANCRLVCDICRRDALAVRDVIGIVPCDGREQVRVVTKMMGASVIDGERVCCHCVVLSESSILRASTATWLLLI
jgi:hypothetical protein